MEVRWGWGVRSERSPEGWRISWVEVNIIARRYTESTIIRLVCIKGDTVFKYRRFRKQAAGAEEDIREQWGEQ